MIRITTMVMLVIIQDSYMNTKNNDHKNYYSINHSFININIIIKVKYPRNNNNNHDNDYS